MTDRISILFVALEKDTRTDDLEALIAAISMMRGVLRVDSKVSSPTEWLAQSRAKLELRVKLLELLSDEK
jgi:hypothetical protein